MLTADQVASVILSRSGLWLTAMQLQKLLYYVQSWHLAVTDQPLFPEHFKAYADGPVIPQVWRSRKDQSTRRADQEDVSGIELDALSSDLIDLVIASYGSLSGDELSALTHAERPWVEARGDLHEGAHGDTPLREESMAIFYRAHRMLGGQTAADIASGGIAEPHRHTEPIDVDALLAAIPETNPSDPWGGANLASVCNDLTAPRPTTTPR